jgi:acyl carrier protein
MGLDSVELVMAVEEEFGIQIANSEAEKILRVRDLHACIMRALQVSNPTAPIDEAVIWTRLREIVVEQLGVEPEEVVPNARFIEDLGMI